MGELQSLLQDLGSYGNVLLHALGRAPATDGARLPARAEVARVVERLHPRRMQMRLVETVDETPTTRTLRLERLDGALPPFRAGQYVSVLVSIGAVCTSRAYSISSAPGEPHLDVTVRRKPGGFVTEHLFTLVPGAHLETSGPTGAFVHEPLIDRGPLVFLAGGSGITPFRSMWRDFERREMTERVHLVFGVRTPREVIYHDELKELAARSPWFTYSVIVSEPTAKYRGRKGLLDAERLRAEVEDLAAARFFVCGPNAMRELVEAALAELGVPRHHVRRELYGPPSDVTLEPGWPADLTGAERFRVIVEGHEAIEAEAREPLLSSLERRGIVLPALCRSGECSACRAHLLAGKVFLPPSARVREADASHGYIHACVAYPVSDLTVRLHPGSTLL